MRPPEQFGSLTAPVAFLLFLTVFISGCNTRYDDLDVSMYHYRDTRNLVKFVYDASLRLEKDGLKSLAYFRNHRDLYNTSDYYLYIYEINGINVYHAGMPQLEGRDLYNITDKNGKKAFQLACEALDDSSNPHGWIHYSWWESGKFYPVPKSSCHFKVTTPEGREFMVGGGIDYPQEEQEFIRIIVDAAVERIESKGRAAFADIADPVSKYNYRDVRVFAFRKDGEVLISPAVNSDFAQTSLLDCTDEAKNKPFARALCKLESADRIWEVFMAKSRYKRHLSKKSLYIRKTEMDGAEIYVAAITDLPEPPA